MSDRRWASPAPVREQAEAATTLYRGGKFPFDRLVRYCDFEDIERAFETRIAVPSRIVCGESPRAATECPCG